MSKLNTARKTAQPAVVKRAHKTARIEVRTSANKRVRYQSAADLKGQTFTEFVEASLDQAAERVHREFEAMTLSQRDAKAFVNALLADTAPSRTLLAAAERYKARADT